MRIVLDLELTCNERPLGFVRKEIESTMLPSVGMSVADMAWKKEREVVHVSLSFDDDYAYVHMGSVDLGDPADHRTRQVSLPKTQAGSAVPHNASDILPPGSFLFRPLSGRTLSRPDHATPRDRRVRRRGSPLVAAFSS